MRPLLYDIIARFLLVLFLPVYCFSSILLLVPGMLVIYGDSHLDSLLMPYTFPEGSLPHSLKVLDFQFAISRRDCCETSDHIATHLLDISMRMSCRHLNSVSPSQNPLSHPQCSPFYHPHLRGRCHPPALRASWKLVITLDSCFPTSIWARSPVHSTLLTPCRQVSSLYG